MGIRQTAFLDRKEKDMYVKIVSYLEDDEGVSSRRGNPKEPVVPTEHWFSEAEEIEYKKIIVPDFDNLGRGRIITGICRIDRDGKPILPSPTNFEVLQIILIRDGNKLERLLARKCTLFLMNNEGRTIDKIVCL